MLLGMRIQKFRKLAQLKIPKNRGELYDDGNISKSKNWKNGKNIGNFTKFEKPKIWVLGNVIRKKHAKFQETSLIRNIQKSKLTIQWGEYLFLSPKTGKNGGNAEIFTKFE